jgi:hypothetical protein
MAGHADHRERMPLDGNLRIPVDRGGRLIWVRLRDLTDEEAVKVYDLIGRWDDVHEDDDGRL